MKRIFALILCLCMFAMPAMAADTITVIVEGSEIEMDQPPVIEDGRTLVPIRAICEALGASQVIWDETTKHIEITLGGKRIELTIDSNTATVNEAPLTIDVPAKIIGDRTMVPVRFISEAADCEVGWDGETKTVNVKKKELTEEERYAPFEKYGPEIVKAVKYMDSKISTDVVNYYASLFDPETGLFYSSTSGKYSYGYHPNIECTSQIYHAIQTGGNVTIYDELTPEQRETLYQTVSQMQDPDDGYFYHPDAPKGVANASRKGRDLSWATKYILGRYTRREPLYMTPDERIEAEKAQSGEVKAQAEEGTSIPEYMKDKETFLKYLEELWPTKTPYGHGDGMGSMNTPAKAAGLYDVLCDFIISKQDPETGLWGSVPGEINYSSTSGAMKLAGYFSGKGIEYKNWQAAMRGCIQVLLDESYAQYIVYIWNPISCIDQIKANLIKVHGKLPQEYWDILLPAIPDIIYNSFRKFEAFSKPDGGYSYSPEYGSSGIIGMTIGQGSYESDIDGTGKVKGFRGDIYDVLQVAQTPVFDSASVDSFFKQLREAKPVVKNTNIEFKNDFESYPIEDKKPHDLSEKVYNDKGSVRVVKNPSDFRKKSLCIDGSKGSRTQTVMSGFSYASENEEVQHFDFDLMLEGGKGQIYHLTMGHKAVVLYVTGSGGDKFTLRYITKGSGSGDAVCKLPTGQWNRIQVEYLPRGVDDTIVRVYVTNENMDRELVLDTNKYSNDGVEGKLPRTSIGRFAISGSNDSTGKVYVDNIHAYSTPKEQ